MKESFNDKTYAYFRSTLDHMYLDAGDNVLIEMNNLYRLDNLPDVCRRYILGFIDYMNNKGVVINKPEELNLAINTDDNVLYFTEGATKIIRVLGSSKRAIILEGAISEFLHYGVVINTILKAV